MSNQNNNQPPERWLYCPKKSALIVNKFLAFKVPLSSNFDESVPINFRWSINKLLDQVSRNGLGNLGLIIDLTNTYRFYNGKAEVERLGIGYCKLMCKGHEESPSYETTQEFIKIVESFSQSNPNDIIGVHCTHGFNRTGFLICSYLVEKLNVPIDQAVRIFAECRTPGIYKQDYLNELFRRYANSTVQVPLIDSLPKWEVNSVKINTEKKVPLFCEPNINGIEVCTDQNEIFHVQKLAQSMCNWNVHRFPGAQPVSMDQQNIHYLSQKRYKVSWKADGTRYLMLINGRDKVYMIDRDNSVFCVRNLQFPHRKDLDKHLSNTLLDGEFVLDFDPVSNQKIPRYLIYDIIHFENDRVGHQNFETRLNCIAKEIIFSRNQAYTQGKLKKEGFEPFSVRQKDFYEISITKKLLSEVFRQQLSHGIDGLIYQPVDEPYIAGRCDSMLKWKPASMNSVDFRLQISLNEGKGYLYVNGQMEPFSTIELSNDINHLNNRIIECRWWENKWDFMRERTDKSTPNHIKTVWAVIESINRPVTEEFLIQLIQSIK